MQEFYRAEGLEEKIIQNFNAEKDFTKIEGVVLETNKKLLAL